MEHIENDNKYEGLAVNKGVAQPPAVNPYLNKIRKVRRRQYTVAEYTEHILKGDITVLSQAVTLVESNREMSALCRKLGTGRYYRCSRIG